MHTIHIVMLCLANEGEHTVDEIALEDLSLVVEVAVSLALLHFFTALVVGTIEVHLWEQFE